MLRSKVAMKELGIEESRHQHNIVEVFPGGRQRLQHTHTHPQTHTL